MPRRPARQKLAVGPLRLEVSEMASDPRNVVKLEEVGRGDVALVGGKNASLGEMIATLSADGIKVPGGFATTADAYWRFIDENVLGARISALLADYDNGRMTLARSGKRES
jgi:pyruvate,water dikinase